MLQLVHWPVWACMTYHHALGPAGFIQRSPGVLGHLRRCATTAKRVTRTSRRTSAGTTGATTATTAATSHNKQQQQATTTSNNNKQQNKTGIERAATRGTGLGLLLPKPTRCIFVLLVCRRSHSLRFSFFSFIICTSAMTMRPRPVHVCKNVAEPPWENRGSVLTNENRASQHYASGSKCTACVGHNQTWRKL
jgi:hypothetical protein